ncbi:MAG: hypothetical protein ACI85I_000374 [Arenicella sp.]|jgi:hypothetical protein
MTQLKLYKWGLGLMVLLNVGMISFFLFTKGKPPRHERIEGNFQKRAIEMLELDEEQANLFFKLAKEHSQQMEELSEQQSVILENQFGGLLKSEL